MGKQGLPRHRTYSVHPIQRTYFSLFLAPLLFFAFFLILLASLPLGPVPQGSVAVLMDFRVWLAILISMIASGLLSYFVTNKFAGPVYRMEQTLRRFKEGDFPASVRVRSDDELQELVSLLDGTFKKFGPALTAIHEHNTFALQKLTVVQRRVKSGANGDVLEGLEAIGCSLREVENILANFKVPMPEAPNPQPSG